MLQFDDVLKHLLGEFGKYQFMVCLLVAPAAIFQACQVVSSVYILAETQSWCKVPDAEVLRGAFCTGAGSKECAGLLRNLTVPQEATGVGCGATSALSQCYRYNITADDIVHSLANDVSLYANATTIACDHGWEYDTSQYQSTVAQQFDLVCDQKYLTSLSTSLMMLGKLVGSSLFGVVSDRFGRKRGFMMGIILTLVFGIVCAFSPTLTFFVIAQFCIGVFSMCVGIGAFVTVTEFLGPSKRAAGGLLTGVCFGIGIMILSLCAYYIRVWWILQLAISLPCVVLLGFSWIIPESPRWLISKGKDKEVDEIIRKWGRINGKSMPDDIFNEEWNPDKPTQMKLKGTAGEKNTFNEMLDLVRLPNMRKKTFLLMYCWVAITLVYYGLIFNTSNLAGSDYLNGFLSGVVEIPACIISLPIIEWRRLGRRLSMFYTLVIAGVTCICSAFVPQCGELEWLGIVLTSISKLSISCAFNIVYIYSGELFPTPVRSTGIGVCSTSARIGGILAPQFLLMADVWAKLPPLVFGGAAVIAGVASLPLPETRGAYLPETMEEGEKFGRKPKRQKLKTTMVDTQSGDL